MKKFLNIFIGLFLLLVIGVLFILLPAHMQTRQITPDLPSAGKITALQNIQNGPISLSYALSSSQFTSKGPLGHPVFIAQWEDGRIFMVDMAMDSAGTQKFADLLKKIYGGEDTKFFAPIHDLLGDAAPRVKGIGFTHLHVDHTQGVSAFCAARSQNQKHPVNAYLTDLQQAKHNFNTKAGIKLIENSCLQNTLITGNGIISIDEFPGLAVVKLGGHTPGSTLFIFNVSGHLWLLSGDIAATKTHLLDNHGKGFLYSYMMVPENTNQTEKLRLWLSKLDAQNNISVIVSHDLNALENSGLKPFQQPN